MVRRNPYTENEVILCTYIARFGRGLVNEELIRSLFDRRTLDSVKMKVRNIARMLSEEGYRHSQEVFPWGGGHRSHWQVVQPYADLADADFTARIKEMLARVKEILARARRPPRDMTPKLVNNDLRNQTYENLGGASTFAEDRIGPSLWPWRYVLGETDRW